MASISIPLFPIDSKPFGYTYGEWTARWWKWLLSIPKPRNPAFDLSGINANVNQIYPNVFFLCQTCEGVRKTPTRTVTVPKGASLLIPIINWISILHVDGETDRELMTVAKERMDVVANLLVTINGLTIKNGLEKYRIQSSPFSISIPENNVIGSIHGMTRAVSDGYWLFIKPFENITRLTSFGSCSSGITKIGVNYLISVA